MHIPTVEEDAKVTMGGQYTALEVKVTNFNLRFQ